MKRKQSKSNSLLLYIFLIIISSYHLPCALHAENLNQNTTFENEIDLYRAKMRNYNPIDAIDYSVAQMNQSTDDRLIDESIHNILEYSINPNKYGELIIALQKLENKNTLSHANRSLAYLARQYFISFQDKDYAYDCLIKNAFSDEPHKDSFSILIKTFNVHNDISSIIKYTYLSSKTDGDIFDFSEIFCWLCYWKSKHLESEASEAFQSILLEADIEDQPAFSILFSIIDQLGQQKVKPNNPSNSIASLNGTSENALLLNSLTNLLENNPTFWESYNDYLQIGSGSEKSAKCIKQILYGLETFNRYNEIYALADTFIRSNQSTFLQLDMHTRASLLEMIRQALEKMNRSYEAKAYQADLINNYYPKTISGCSAKLDLARSIRSHSKEKFLQIINEILRRSDNRKIKAHAYYELAMHSFNQEDHLEAFLYLTNSLQHIDINPIDNIRFLKERVENRIQQVLNYDLGGE